MHLRAPFGGPRLDPGRIGLGRAAPAGLISSAAQLTPQTSQARINDSACTGRAGRGGKSIYVLVSGAASRIPRLQYGRSYNFVHDTLTSYDELPNDSLPLPETQPDFLAAVAGTAWRRCARPPSVPGFWKLAARRAAT